MVIQLCAACLIQIKPEDYWHTLRPDYALFAAKIAPGTL